MPLARVAPSCAALDRAACALPLLLPVWCGLPVSPLSNRPTIRLSFARACVRRSPRVCGLSSPQPTRALVGADGRCGPPRGCSSCLPFPLASGSTVAARAQCVSPTVGLDPSSRVPWLLVLASFAHARGVDRLSSPQGGRWGGGGDAWNAPVVHARPPPPNASSQQAPPNAAGQGDGGEQRVAD